MIVIIALPVLLFRTEQVHLASHVGCIDEMISVGLIPRLELSLAPSLIKKTLEPLGSQSLSEAA
jgi:hypothetical protein